MKAYLRCSVLGYCIAGLLPVSALAQPTVLMKVSEINGIDVPGAPAAAVDVVGGDVVTLEVFVRDWSPTGQELRGYQTMVNFCGYTSGLAGNVYPRGFATTTDLNGYCTAGACAGAGCSLDGDLVCGATNVGNPANIFTDSADCFADGDPEGSDVGFWSNGGCDLLDCVASPTGTDRCVDSVVTHPFVFANEPASSAQNEAINSTTLCGGRWINGLAAGIAGPVSPQDGSEFYLGTIIVEISADAAGTFTIGFAPESPIGTFLASVNQGNITPLSFESAALTVLVGACCEQATLTCVGTEPSSDCLARGPGHTWSAGEDCATFTCPACPCALDVDDSGGNDLVDVLIVISCLNGVAPDPIACDVNCDGDVDLFDLEAVLCALAGGTAPACCVEGLQGACQLDNGASCLVGPQGACEALGGIYLGDGTTCDVGRCCYTIANLARCEDGISRTACDEVDGFLAPLLTCAESNCAIDCNGNGVPDEDDITFEFSADNNGNGIPDECEEGACCLDGGETCTMLVAGDCETLGGTFFGERVLCSQQAVGETEVSTGGGGFTLVVEQASVCPGAAQPGVFCNPTDPKQDPWRLVASTGIAPCSGSSVQFNASDAPAVGANFFGPGSNVLTGEYCLEGVPLGVTVSPDFPNAHVVLERSDPPLPPPPTPSNGEPFDTCDAPRLLGQNIVELDIRYDALSMKAIGAIPVTFNNGSPAQSWKLFIRSLPNTPSTSQGKLFVEKTHCDGGVYRAANLMVNMRYVFLKESAIPEMTPGELAACKASCSDAGCACSGAGCTTNFCAEVDASDVETLYPPPGQPNPEWSTLEPEAGMQPAWVVSNPCSSFHPGIETPESAQRLKESCDCLGNGVMDICDIDPSDPDGDGIVFADCMVKLKPDICDGAYEDSCPNNGVADACDPDCNGNGTPDFCGDPDPLCSPQCDPEDTSHPEFPGKQLWCFGKVRFISFVGSNPGIVEAIRVTYVDQSGVEVKKWVQGPNPSGFAKLGCDPCFRDWGSQIIDVGGLEIVPSKTYLLHSLPESFGCVGLCDCSDENNYRVPLRVTTADWGDVQSPSGRSRSLGDLLDLLDALEGTFAHGSASRQVWYDLVRGVGLPGAGLDDLLAMLDILGGNEAFPSQDPAPTCDADPCGGPLPCDGTDTCTCP